MRLNFLLYIACMLVLFSIVLVPPSASAKGNQFDFSVSDIIYQSKITSKGAKVAYSVSATNNDNPATALCSPTSGSLFPVGDTTVTCSSKANQITGVTSFIINVSGNDSTPPSITPPPDVTAYQKQDQTDPLTFVDIGVPLVNDDIDLSPYVTNNYPDSEFPLGDSTVTWIAIDHSGNSNISYQTVTVLVANGDTITHMSDTTVGTGQSIYSARQIHAEYVSPTSQLVGDFIHTITVKLKKSGSPTGLAQIGVFNADLSVKQMFSTIDVSKLTTSYTDYTFSLPSGQSYQVQSNDRIGVKYSGGDGTNFIAIIRDTVAADPFDGANSYNTYYTSAWFGNTTYDLYMILEGSDGIASFQATTTVNVEDNTIPIVSTSPSGGLYNSTQRITLSASGPSIIYYTTNGDVPTTSSTIYNSPIPIGSTIPLKFFAKTLSGNSGKVETSWYTIDTISPVITLNGSQFVSVDIYSPYFDDGAIATDNIDGDITPSIVTVNSVDTSILGTNIVSYTVNDSAGNSATATRIIEVVDEIPPVITIFGSNPVSIDLGLAYFDEGATALDNFDGDITSSISTINSVNTSVIGTYTVTYNVMDRAGNVTPEVTRFVNVGDGLSPTTTAFPPGGTFTSTQFVMLTSDTSATIYYTTDGSTPNTSSNVYSVYIPISTTTTLLFLAVDTAGNTELPQTEVYTINPNTNPQTTIPPSFGGTNSSKQLVTLTGDEPSVIGFYINDMIATSSQTYIDPIQIP